MWEKKALALLAATMLMGCATNYPDLFSTSAPPAAAPSLNPEVDKILADAANLQATYASGYKTSAKIQDYSQLPIVGAATAAALVVLENHSQAAINAGKIGIGAGSYAAIRSQLIAQGLPDAYIAGHGALTCVIAEGSNFSGENAKALYRRQDTELQNLADAIADLSQAENDPIFGGTLTTPQSDTLKSARTLAGQAVEQARTAEAAALSQKAAFDNAAPIFRNAVASISVRVASKGRVRPAVDFITLRDSFAPPKVPSKAQAQGAGPADVDHAIANINAKIVGLVTQTGTVTAATRPYSQSLTRVAACPDQIK